MLEACICVHLTPEGRITFVSRRAITIGFLLSIIVRDKHIKLVNDANAFVQYYHISQMAMLARGHAFFLIPLLLAAEGVAQTTHDFSDSSYSTATTTQSLCNYYTSTASTLSDSTPGGSTTSASSSKNVQDLINRKSICLDDPTTTPMNSGNTTPTTDDPTVTLGMPYSSDSTLSTTDTLLSISDPTLSTKTTESPFLAPLESALSLLGQIDDEIERYKNNIDNNGYSSKKSTSRDKEDADELNQAYEAIGITASAVENLDVDYLDEATLYRLVVALQELEQANYFLERDEDNVSQLLEKHPNVDEELGQLSDESVEAQDAVQTRIEIVYDPPSNIPIEYIRGKTPHDSIELFVSHC